MLSFKRRCRSGTEFYFHQNSEFLTGISLQNCKFIIRKGVLHIVKHLLTLLSNFRQQKMDFSFLRILLRPLFQLTITSEKCVSSNCEINYSQREKSSWQAEQGASQIPVLSCLVDSQEQTEENQKIRKQILAIELLGYKLDLLIHLYDL